MATASSQSYYNEVQSIFIELFDRPAATAGYNYFGSELATGANPVTVFGQISDSSEVTSSVTVNSLFENLLGRAAGAPALAFFGGELASHTESIAGVANQIYNDVLNESHTSQDYMVMTDKIDYANSYTGYLATNPSFTYNTANAQAYVNQVTVPGVMTGAITSTNMPAVTSFVAGTTVDLVTTQTSYIEPASNGIVDFVLNSGASAAQTLSTTPSLANDTLQAGAGGATLTINDGSGATSGSSTSAGISGVTMSGVSTIVVNGDSTTDKIDISGLTGVTGLTINQGVLTTNTLTTSDKYTVSSTQTLTLENVASGSSVDVNSTGTSANVSLDNVALTADLNVNSSSKSAIATLNLVNLSGTNTLTLNDTTSTLSAITVTSTDTSSKDSTTITGYGNIDSVNASADQGTLTYIMPSSITNSSKAFTFTGGTGTDTVSLVSAPSSSITYAFDGNSAGTNTLEINYNTSLTAADLKTYTNDASNFHNLLFGPSVSTSMPTIDMANINSAFTNVTFSSGATTIDVKDALGTGSTGTSGDVFNINQNITNSLTVSDASGNNAVNFTMGGGFTVAAIDTYLSPSAGVAPQSYINIVSNSSSAHSGGNTITALNVADGATVNLSGSAALNVTLNDATTSPTPTAGLTVNAGSFAGTLNVNAVTANVPFTFTLGSGTDTITTNTGANDTITVGTASTAADTITVNAVAANTAVTVSSSYAVTNQDIITNGSALNTRDSFVFTTTGATTVTITNENKSSLVTGATSLGDALSGVIHSLQATDSASTTADSIAWFNYGGNTYVINDNSISTGPAYLDEVVKITGTVNLSSATATVASHVITMTTL